jgi:hypothetical protein
MRWPKRLLFIVTIFIATLIGLAGVAILALPLWLPPAIKAALNQAGVEYSSVTGIDSQRFELRDIVWSSDTLSLTINQIETRYPHSWLLGALRGESLQDPRPFLRVSGTSIDLNLPESEAHPDREAPELNLPLLFDDLQGIWKLAARWAPLLLLEDVRVHVADETIEIANLTWHRGRLGGEASARGQTFFLETDFSEGNKGSLRLDLPAEDFVVTILMERSEASLDLSLESRWQENAPFTISATYGPEVDLFPVVAAFTLPDWSIPTALFTLEGYEALRLNADGAWADRSSQIDLSARLIPAPPAEGSTPYPAVELFLQVKASPEGFVIENWDLQSDVLSAHLSDPLALQPTLQQRLATQLNITADLARQPFLPLRGQLVATLDLHGETNQIPEATFTAEVADFQWEDLPTLSLKSTGSFSWPKLELSALEIGWGEASQVSAKGHIDLVSHQGDLALTGQLQSTEIRSLNEAIPEWESLTFDLTLGGNWPGIETSFSARLKQLHLPDTPVEGLDLTLDLSGKALNELAIKAGASFTSLLDHISTEATLAWRGSSATLDLTLLTIAWADHASLWNLAGDTHVRYVLPPDLIETLTSISLTPLPETSAEKPVVAPGTASIENFTLRRGEADFIQLSAEVRYPESGQVTATLSSIPLAKFELPLSQWDHFHLELFWDESTPLSGTGDFFSQLAIVDLPLEETSLRGEWSWTEGEFNLSPLTLSWQESPVLEAALRLPLEITLQDPTAFLETVFDRDFAFHLESKANPAWWDYIGENLDLMVTPPTLTASLTGTLRQPEGTLEFALTNLQANPIEDLPPLPAIEDIKVLLTLTGEAILLQDSGFSLAGNRADLSATLTLPEGGIPGFASESAPPLTDLLSATLSVPSFTIASLGQLRPAALRPTGKVQIDFELREGLRLGGGVTIRDVSTFPLPAVGAIRDIEFDLRFDDRLITVDRGSLHLGGRELRIDGTTDLSNLESPRFDLHARGERLTLVRQPGIILRSDLDLRLQTDDNGRTRLSGMLGLQDSFLLIEMPDLIPSPAQPSTRPPYFIVEDAPFSDWDLDIQLVGTEFLNLRNSYVEALISLDMRLSGQLGDPFLLGDALIDRGVIKFPFARFRIQSGLVRLSESDPYMPSLNLNANVRTVGYSIDMNLSGTAANPALEFSSSPSLDQTDIILLVTTGQAPEVFTGRSGAGRLGSLGLYFGSGLMELFGNNSLDREESWIERIDVVIGANFTESGKSTIEVDIPFSDRWSFQAEYDEYDAYNLNARWRIFSR